MIESFKVFLNNSLTEALCIAVFKINILLCDSPGKEDTNDAEVEIANSLSIVEAFKLWNSLKVVIV